MEGSKYTHVQICSKTKIFQVWSFAILRVNLKHKVFGRMMVEDVSAKDNKFLEWSVMPTCKRTPQPVLSSLEEAVFFPRVTSALSVREEGAVKIMGLRKKMYETQCLFFVLICALTKRLIYLGYRIFFVRECTLANQQEYWSVLWDHLNLIPPWLKVKIIKLLRIWKRL